MPSNAILYEATQLHKVSHRLDLLAEEHPLVSAALITISGSIRNGNSVGSAGSDQDEAALWTRSSECLIGSSLSASLCLRSAEY
jgi:hypothetical protein